MRQIMYYNDKKQESFSIDLRRVLFAAEERARQLEFDHVAVIDLFYGMRIIFDECLYEEAFMSGISVLLLDEINVHRTQFVTTGRLPYSPQARKVTESVWAVAKSWGHYTPNIRHLAFSLFGCDSGKAILEFLGIKAAERQELVRSTTPCPTEVFHPWVVDSIQARISASN